ncbi:hypothetical protein SCLCIDRAFT_26927 [Scleroderma citrinum Foug A]|uniref:Uncharacterized protein n=1 Tax=Scleroderma citrinum Foug A TaxID=1036808 RepID=A0A0C2ZE12_9AGAM|nr:hypothetical protein SCLCIDRAFT_26927 [Scleroderma citrinum Foug A]
MSSLPPSSFPPTTPMTTRIDTGGTTSDRTTGITAIFATSSRPNSMRMASFEHTLPPLSGSPSPSLHTGSLSLYDEFLSSTAIESTTALSESDTQDIRMSQNPHITQNSPSPDPDNSPYLHLELACARRAVLQVRARLAACELSEQISRTHFYRLKVKRVRKQLDDASNGVGQICDQIRRSGRTLHHQPILQKPSRHRVHILRSDVDEFAIDLQ